MLEFARPWLAAAFTIWGSPVTWLEIVADAASRFDWVIVDSPPVGVLADAHLVSETVDAALLVVRAGVTRFLPAACVLTARLQS